MTTTERIQQLRAALDAPDAELAAVARDHLSAVLDDAEPAVRRVHDLVLGMVTALERLSRHPGEAPTARQLAEAWRIPLP